MNLTDQIAERYVPEVFELDPVWGTLAGISGHDDRMADLSPGGFEARADLDRRTIAAVRAVAPASEPEQVARAAMLERLGLAVEQYDAGDTTSDINVIASWMHSVRWVFDLMPVDGEQAQRDLAVRMAAVPQAYAGLSRTYAAAAAQGRVAARRQVEGCAQQCASWSSGGGFYAGLVERTRATGALRAQLDKAAQDASAATAEFGRFLRTDLLPLAPERDAVGRERYDRASRSSLGAAVDLDEAYAWAGRRYDGSKRKWHESRAGSFPAGPWSRLSPRSRPTRRGGSQAGRTCGPGCRTTPMPPSRSCTARTLTFPSQPAGSSA